VYRFCSVYTGALTDVLDRHGYLQQTLPAEIVPLRPGSLAGRVYPVLGRPHPGHDYDRSIRRILELLGSVPPESVAVYETNDRAAAHFDELSAISLASRGCAGAVIDGGARDADYILREEFPVFSRYITPQDCVPRWELLAHGEVTDRRRRRSRVARRLDRRRSRRARNRAGRTGARDPERGRGEGRDHIPHSEARCSFQAPSRLAHVSSFFLRVKSPLRLTDRLNRAPVRA
jgi:hypothetical protein